VGVEVLGAHVCLVGHLLVADGLEIGVVGAGDVGALDLEEQIAFLDVVIEAGADVDDLAAGEGDRGHLARDVRVDRTGDVQLRGRVVLLRGDEGKLVGLIDGDQAHVAGWDDLRLRGCAVGGIERLAVTPCQVEANCRARSTVEEGLVD
jgi:hypothetical protein